MAGVDRSPLAQGALDVGDGHRCWWEIHGEPTAPPALVLHGGPGSGCSPGLLELFDLERHLVVLLDQRGCGRSTPWAGAPDVDLSANTTARLVADCERLREHLEIDRWLVWGGSWGSVLALAYAEAHPSAVRALVLTSVVDPSQRQVAWITRSMGRVFPEAHERFLACVPHVAEHGDVARAYAELLADPDPAVHDAAAAAWCAWEEAHLATVPGRRRDPRFRDPGFRRCFARLVTHYWSNGCFLDEGQLERDAHRLSGIPGVLIEGRLDISSPVDTAWSLARVWPDAKLVVVEDAGHGAGPGPMARAVRSATDRFGGPSGGSTAARPSDLS